MGLKLGIFMFLGAAAKMIYELDKTVTPGTPEFRAFQDVILQHKYAVDADQRGGMEARHVVKIRDAWLGFLNAIDAPGHFQRASEQGFASFMHENGLVEK